MNDNIEVHEAIAEQNNAAAESNDLGNVLTGVFGSAFGAHATLTPIANEGIDLVTRVQKLRGYGAPIEVAVSIASLVEDVDQLLKTIDPTKAEGRIYDANLLFINAFAQVIEYYRDGKVA